MDENLMTAVEFLADCNCPLSYTNTLFRLVDFAAAKGQEDIFIALTSVVDRGLKKATCVRCKATREDLFGHLYMMLYTPQPHKGCGYIAFVCPGCSHPKFVKEVETIVQQRKEDAVDLE